MCIRDRVRPEQARLVSSLLYGTLFLTVKCTSVVLHLKMFVFSIYLWNFGKIFIFLASSDCFNVKNDIIHTFFSLFWLQILNLPASLQNKNTRIGPFPWKRSVLQNPDRERTNQSTGIWVGLGLPYNNARLFWTYSRKRSTLYKKNRNTAQQCCSHAFKRHLRMEAY